jgi:hypothetical protein
MGPVKGPLAGRRSPWPATESPATPPVPGVETNFPVGPASARKLGYDPLEIDALPHSVTESFCGVGNPLGLGEAPDEVSGTLLPPTLPLENPRTSWYTTAVPKPLATLARNQDHERAEPDH